MLLFENVRLALSAIRINKMRSFLTMLGIIIGISSVISITAIGASAKAVISKEFESIGAAYLYIMVNWRNSEEARTESDFFSFDDVEALKQRFPDDIRYATLYSSTNASAKVGRNEGTLSLMGVDDGYTKFNKGIEIKYGRMINKGDVDGSRENIVIDIKAARFFFNKENAVGKVIPANFMGNDRDLTVVGVYDVPASIFSQFDMSSSYTCYAPISLLLGRDDISSYIEVYGNENKSVTSQATLMVNYITKVKDKKEGYYIYESAESQMSTINTVLGTLSIALGAIAAISLLVGGIGIMNIMLVSVTERTREIGVRKSLGARTKDILTQFLIEAMILSCIGGIIGTATGTALAGIGMGIFGIDVVIQPIVIVITVLFSAGVGMFFGLFPARKAAKLDPIEALRYE